MSTLSEDKIFIGPFIHTNEQGQLIIVDDGVIYVKDGKVLMKIR